MEIIDFHTHPFTDLNTNICIYKENSFDISPMESMHYLKNMGIDKICGSVIMEDKTGYSGFDAVKKVNDTALYLKELYGDFYIPGFIVHPDYPKESMEEIERMHKLGINLIGEVVPAKSEWDVYTSKSFYEILDLAKDYNMILNIHSMDPDEMDRLVENNKSLTIIGAHPGEYYSYIRHIERMKKYKNYYLDLSGTGLFRHAMLRYGIDECGAERFIFGSDYPVCNPAMYIGAVLNDSLLSDKEKELVLSGNIKRILNS